MKKDKVRNISSSVPDEKARRMRVLRAVQSYCYDSELVVPLSLESLRSSAEEVCVRYSFEKELVEFVAVILNNELWRSRFSQVPFEKRLLLIPKCLRNFEKCRAVIDSVGLLCEECGECLIGDVKAEAEELGYAVLVAEGSPIVMSLLETGKIEAVLGVSCLSVLERTFPYVLAGAFPGIAVPLLFDGCKDTEYDPEVLRDYMYACEDSGSRVNLGQSYDRVKGLFLESNLNRLFSEDSCSAAAVEWLGFEGKRWRPLLCAAGYDAVKGGSEDKCVVNDLAVAVECFHKASLVHDDIEDGAKERYGKPVMHEKYGVAKAINVGDYLVGKGYEIVSGLDVDARIKGELLEICSKGHVELCRGQQREFDLRDEKRVPRLDELLDLFAMKTSPAFEVALLCGVAAAGEFVKCKDVISEFSRNVGIAYQIGDDIDDYLSVGALKGEDADQQSVMFSIVAMDCDEKELGELESAIFVKDNQELRRLLIGKYRARARAVELLEDYRGRAIAVLEKIDNVDLKILLRRILGKIFNDMQIMECCNEDA